MNTHLLIALLAGSGLRIGEALALKFIPDDGKSTVWLPNESKIIVRVQKNGQPVKTDAGEREVDLPDDLNKFILTTNLDNGIIFNRSEGYYRSELKKLGLTGGFHSLRRFRVTHLRLQGVPDSLVHFWIGHEDSTVTGRYTEVGPEILKRKQEANRAGLGFELPD